MPRAIWNGVVIAESDATEVMEGNHYFPPKTIKQEHFQESATKSECPWKGTASYYHLNVNGEVNSDAAFYYPEPKPAAVNIKDYVAFWKDVEVQE